MTSRSPATRERGLLRGDRLVVGEPGRRRDDLGADAVGLDGAHDGVGDGLAVRAARHLRRQLLHEVDALLGEPARARASVVEVIRSCTASASPRPTRRGRRSRRARS